MFIRNKYNSTLYTMPRYALYASVGRDHTGSYIAKDVCIYNPEYINNWEQQKRPITVWCCYYKNMGLYMLTFVIYNFNILRLLILIMKLRATGT
jgi:hypothetical protein